MKEYILSIAGIVLISALITILSPSGKTGKFVKGMSRLAILVVMLAPVAGWISGEQPKAGESLLQEADGGYLDACAQKIERADEEEIERMLSERYGCGGEANVLRKRDGLFSPQKITIRLDLSGINDEDERIHIMTCVERDFKAKYGCEVEVTG